MSRRSDDVIRDPAERERRDRSDSLRERIAARIRERTPRPPYEIDPATGRRRAVAREGEAFNPMPYAMRPGVRVAYKVRGEARERTYAVATAVEALTRLAVDEPAAYEASCTLEEVPVES